MIAQSLQILEAVFAWLLEASWQASVLAGLVLLVKWIFRKRLNPRWHHALWLLVLARLLMPGLPHSAVSVFQFTPAAPVTVMERVQAPIFQRPSHRDAAQPSLPVDSAPLISPEIVPAHAPAQVAPVHSLAPAPSAHPFTLYTILALTWLIGACTFLMATVFVNGKFVRHMARAPEMDDGRIADIAKRASQEMGVRRAVRLVESPRVGSPAIMGLFRPTLLLPANARARFNDEELRLIFLHEFAHLKRGDVLGQWLIAILQIVHWFNPVLWYCFRRMRADREPATDALVLSHAHPGEAQSYGHVLIKLLEHYHQRHSLPTLVGILEDKSELKRRFTLVAMFKSGGYAWSALGTVLTVILALLCLTGTGTHKTLAQSSTGINQPVAASGTGGRVVTGTNGSITSNENVGQPPAQEVINLKPYYTKVFNDPSGSDSSYKSFAGPKMIGGLPFDIGGEMVMYGKDNDLHGTMCPMDIADIEIGRKFEELHLIHATQWEDYYGSPVAKIRLHYADGTTANFPMRFNFEVSDWNRLYSEDEERIGDGTKIVWRGPGVYEGEGRLFESVLTNPHPEKKVDSMEVISTGANASYVLVAATTAARDTARDAAPGLPLRESRHFDGALKVQVFDRKTGKPVAGAQINPLIGIKTFDLAANIDVTGSDGTAAVKYPKDATKSLSVEITASGYGKINHDWHLTWDAGQMPEEITVRMSPRGTEAENLPGKELTVNMAANETLAGAIKSGDADGLKRLIAQGADVKTAALKVDKDTDEPLAFSAGTPEVLDALLENGLDANMKDARGTPILNSLCGVYQTSNPAEYARVLLRHGADANGKDAGGGVPLQEAADGATVDLLVKHGADITLKEDGSAKFVRYVWMKKPDYLDALIRHGMPFDLKRDGATVLVHAAWSWDTGKDMMKWALARGVDPNWEGDWSVQNGKPEMMLPLEAAAVDGQYEAAKLLLDHGAKPEPGMRDALGSRHYKIVKLLWDHGARNIPELTYQVSQNAPMDQLRKLAAAGISGTNAQGIYSPLTVAAAMGNLEAVRMLTEQLVKTPRDEGEIQEALSEAASEGQDEVVSFLLAHGAKATTGALADAGNNSDPYEGEQRTKDHFEKTMKLLVDAGALKGADLKSQGQALFSTVFTRQGEPNATAVKIVLDGGASPAAPMPYIYGAKVQKTESIIDAVRDAIASLGKDDTTRRAQFQQILDMLRARNGSAPSASPSHSGTTAASAVQGDDVADMPPSAGSSLASPPMARGFIRVEARFVQMDQDVWAKLGKDNPAIQEETAEFGAFADSRDSRQPSDGTAPNARQLEALKALGTDNWTFIDGSWQTISAVAGAAVLTDKSFQGVLRYLDGREGVEMLAVPAVNPKPGDAVRIEAVREYHYPSKFELSKGARGRWTPKTFTEKDMGVSLELRGTVKTTGTLANSMDLELSPAITDFLGFLPEKNGGKIEVGEMHESPGYWRPIFSILGGIANVTVLPGQTVMLAGIQQSRKNSRLNFEEPAHKNIGPDSIRHRVTLIFVTPVITSGSGSEVDTIGPQAKPALAGGTVGSM